MFKPCCEMVCLVGGCKTREAGACYCVCRLHDHLNNLINIKHGNTIGPCYYPSKEKADAHLKRLSEVDRENYNKRLDNIDNEIEEVKRKIETYKLNK